MDQRTIDMLAARQRGEKLDDIGKRYGISGQRVHQIVSKVKPLAIIYGADGSYATVHADGTITLTRKGQN